MNYSTQPLVWPFKSPSPINDRAKADDQHWFARNKKRHIRLREPMTGDAPGIGNATLVFLVSSGLRIRIPITLKEPWTVADFKTDRDLALMLYSAIQVPGSLPIDEPVRDLMADAVARLQRQGRLPSHEDALAHARTRAEAKGLKIEQRAASGERN